MKRLFWLLNLVLLSGLAARAGTETNTPSKRVGVYDSRVVAMVYFWSGPVRNGLQKQMAAAQAAKQSGDTNTLNTLAAALQEKQAEMHREVFSIAPATDALAALKDRLPAIEKSAGVIAVVSKWDEAALQGYKDAEQMDVTDTLVHEFVVPNEKQAKMIESIKTAKPLPLDECNELIRRDEI